MLASEGFECRRGTDGRCTRDAQGDEAPWKAADERPWKVREAQGDEAPWKAVSRKYQIVRFTHCC